MMECKKKIERKALTLGFDLAGVTTAAPLSENYRRSFQDWLNKGNAAGMEYLGRNIEKRFDPSKLLDEAKSVICVALNYKPPPNIPVGPCKIANYALYEDYHEFIKQRLFQLADFISQSTTGKNIRFRVCVDSAPLAERLLAQRAGLGAVGKHKSLIHPAFGGQLLLGELITTLELAADEPFEENLCGDCVRCIQSCPTGALGGDGDFDSRKCISYLTIEEKGDVPKDLAEKISNRLFGCDECVLACPYQAAAPACSNKDFQIFPERSALQPEQILNWTQDDFDRYFKNSSVERLGLERLKRNARICRENLFPSEFSP
jgi:epoxyqueuosine reductase